MNEWEKNTALSFFLLISWVPSRHFYSKGHVFSRELGRILSHVTKEPRKIYVSKGYFQFQNHQKMYTFCPFQLQLVFGNLVFFKSVSK